jgi:pectate lyase
VKGSGGTTATGGAGGAKATGGTTGTGGTSPTGGTTGTGGTKATGGTTGTGGTPATGGTTGTGGSSATDQPIGWASVNALGQNGTTGGGSGPVTTVTTCSALKSAVSQSGAAVVKVSGTITCDDVIISSNKSVIGLSGAKLVATSGTTNHLLVVQNVSNIIVRNLTLQGAGITSGNKSGGDTFHIESSVHHLWADHLDISDGDDGNLDITHNCDYITVSWTKFHYTSSSRVHRFSDLIAAALGDTGTYKITWHHNWWATNVDQRSPRAHEGSGGIHLFNNYYSEAGNTYCVGVGQNAIFLSENNYFDGVNVPFYMTPNGETGGQILSKGDVFHNTTGNTTGTNTGFTPPYPYTLDPVANVQAIVQAGAGATM